MSLWLWELTTVGDVDEHDAAVGMGTWGLVLSHSVCEVGGGFWGLVFWSSPPVFPKS